MIKIVTNYFECFFISNYLSVENHWKKKLY